MTKTGGREPVKRIPVKRKSIVLYNLGRHTCKVFQEKIHMEVVRTCEKQLLIPIDLGKTDEEEVENIMSSLEELTFSPALSVKYEGEGMDILEFLLEKLNTLNLPVILTTYSPLSNQVIDLLSINKDNMLQTIITDLNAGYNRKMMYAARTSGIYNVVRVEPIIPEVTKVWELIDLLSSMRGNLDHLSLRFVEFYRSETNDRYLYLGDNKIDSAHMEYTNGKYHCSAHFITTFLRCLDNYTKPLKIKYTVCGDCTNCKGVPTPFYKKEGNMFNPIPDQNNTVLKYLQMKERLSMTDLR